MSEEERERFAGDSFEGEETLLGGHLRAATYTPELILVG
jgi:hypothetical protein